MNGLYDILLFLFILGAVTQGFNEIGVFNNTIPDSGVTLSDTAVEEIHTSALSQDTEQFNWIEIIKSFMRVIGMGVLAMFTIIPMIINYSQAVGVDYGLALILATILQAPITFVTLFGLWEFWTGRPST